MVIWWGWSSRVGVNLGLQHILNRLQTLLFRVMLLVTVILPSHQRMVTKVWSQRSYRSVNAFHVNGTSCTWVLGEKLGLNYTEPRKNQAPTSPWRSCPQQSKGSVPTFPALGCAVLSTAELGVIGSYSTQQFSHIRNLILMHLSYY
jgi:hypothetical protein